MTTHHTKTNDEFLRRTFDFIYSIDLRELRRAFNRIDSRTRWLLITIAASAVLLLVVLQFTKAAIQAVEWANRPSLQDRLAAPYDLEARPVPQLPEASATEAPAETSVEAAAEAAEAAPVYLALPAALQGFTLQAEAASPSLLEQCLLSASGQDKAPCTLSRAAHFIEAGSYIAANGQSVGVILAQFASEKDAAQALLELYRYSRSIGRIGNYALLETRPVDYYYSSTRQQFAFSWSNGPWVYTASSASFETLEQFMSAFQY